MDKKYIIDLYGINENIYNNFYETFVFFNYLYGGIKRGFPINKQIVLLKENFTIKHYISVNISSFFYNMKNKNKKSIVIDLSDRFDYLRKKISIETKKTNHKVYDIRPNNTMQKIFNFGMLTYYSKNLRKLVQKLNVDNANSLLFDKNYLSAVQLELSISIENVRNRLVKLNTKKIFFGDRADFRRKILSFSAKRLNIPTYSIPHGYPSTNSNSFNTPSLYNDYVLSWDPQMTRYLKKFKTNDKVIQFGYPTIDQTGLRKYNIKKKKNRLLYAVNGFADLEIVFQISSMLKVLQKNGFETYARIHPKQHNHSKLEEIIQNNGVSISNSSLLSDILLSEIVIGYDTSFIYDSYMMNTKTLQINIPNRRIIFENIPEIELEEIVNLYSLIRKIKTNNAAIENLSHKIEPLINSEC